MDSPLESSKTPVELAGLKVTVDQVTYQPEASTPPDQPYCFVYYITIHNHSNRTVTIKGRKWVVTNKGGEVIAVEGSGVVGQTPRLATGEHFSYHSYHLTNTPSAVAEGSYLGLDDEGRAVYVRIPPFRLEVN